MTLSVQITFVQSSQHVIAFIFTCYRGAALGALTGNELPSAGGVTAVQKVAEAHVAFSTPNLGLIGWIQAREQLKGLGGGGPAARVRTARTPAPKDVCA